MGMVWGGANNARDLTMRVVRKRTLTGLVAAVYVLGVAGFAFRPSTASAFSGSGSGTAGSPYQITSCAQLLEISAALTAHYELAQSIDCIGVSFTPIGNGTTPFNGTFDGKGNEIKNVTINVAADDVGIFGVVDAGDITDVRLKNISVTGQSSVGVIAGRTNYTDVTYIAAHNITVVGSGSNVGGLVGYLGGSQLNKSFAEGVDVTGGGSIIGGLVGYAVGPTTVTQSYVAGEITANTNVGGVVGQLGAGPAIAQELYADMTFNLSGSSVIGTVAFGATSSSLFMASAPYLGNNTQSPLDSWDFGTVWYVRPGKYPGLRPHTLPMLLCNAPSSTSSSVTGSCTSEPLLEGGTQWELQYGFEGDTAKTNLTTQSGQLFNVTVSNLLSGTEYAVYFRYVDAIGTSQWGRVVATTAGSQDIDGDGATNKDEFKAPNNGDANGDSVDDYTQANVTSFLSTISNSYMVLSTQCADNFNVQLGRESSQYADKIFDYPTGLMAFVIRGCSVGATTTVNVLHYGAYAPSDYIARKNKGAVYTTLPGASLSSVTLGGQSALKLSYSITDGGALDDDGIADGNIVDPVGIAPKAGAVGVPNTGLGLGQ